MTAVLPDTRPSGPREDAPDVLEGSRPVRQTAAVPTAPALVRRLSATARAVPGFTTYVGVGLATLGVVLLVFAWGKVAGLTSVALQVPYVVSAGFGGLGLVAVGLTVISIAAKQADAAERTRQLAELRDLLAELRSTVEEQR